MSIIHQVIFPTPLDGSAAVEKEEESERLFASVESTLSSESVESTESTLSTESTESMLSTESTSSTLSTESDDSFLILLSRFLVTSNLALTKSWSMIIRDDTSTLVMIFTQFYMVEGGWRLFTIVHLHQQLRWWWIKLEVEQLVSSCWLYISQLWFYGEKRMKSWFFEFSRGNISVRKKHPSLDLWVPANESVVLRRETTKSFSRGNFLLQESVQTSYLFLITYPINRFGWCEHLNTTRRCHVGYIAEKLNSSPDIRQSSQGK